MTESFGAGGQMFLGIRLHMDSSGVVTGASMAESSMKGIQMQAANTTKSVQNMADGITRSLQMAMSAGIAGLASLGAGKAIEDNLFKPMTEQTKAFESELKGLQFVANLTSKELENVSDRAKQIGVDTQFSPQEAVAGMRGMLATGMELMDVYEALPAALDFVTGSRGAVDLATGMDSVAGAMKKFIKTGEDANEIMDSFAHATRTSNLRPEDFEHFMRSLRDAPIKLKMTAAETFALGGALRNTTLTAAQSGQAIAGFGRQVILNQRMVQRFLDKKGISMSEMMGMSDKELGKMSARMGDKVKAFRNFGVQIFDEETGKMRKIIDILTELGDRSGELLGENEARFRVAAQSLFGQQAGGILEYVQLMKVKGKEGVDAFREHYNRLSKEATGANREMAASVEDTLIGVEKFIEGTKQTLAIVAGETLKPYERAWADFRKEVWNTLLGFVKEHPTITKAFLTVAWGMGQVLKVGGMLLLGIAAVATAATMLGPAFTAMAASLGVTVGTMLTGVLGALAVGLAKVGILVYGAYLLWNSIWSKDASGMFLALQNVLTDIKLVFKGFKDWSDGIVDDMDLFNQLNERGLVGWVFTLLQMRDRVVASWDGMVDGFKSGIKWIMMALTWVSEGIGAVISFFSELLKIKQAADISAELSVWSNFGRVLGYVAAIGMSLIIAKYVILGVKIAITTAGLLAQAAAWALVHAKTMLVIGGIMLGIWAYSKIIDKAAEFGEKLGPSLYDAMTEVFTTMEIFWTGLKRWGSDLGAAFSDAFRGKVQPLVDWFKEWVNFVWTAFKWAAGNAEMSDLQAAIPKAFQMSQTEKDDIRYRQENRGAGNVKKFDPEAYRAKMEKRNSDTMAFNAILRELASRGRTVQVDNLMVEVKGKSPNEALKLAREIMQKIADAEDEEAEESYR